MNGTDRAGEPFESHERDFEIGRARRGPKRIGDCHRLTDNRMEREATAEYIDFVERRMEIMAAIETPRPCHSDDEAKRVEEPERETDRFDRRKVMQSALAIGGGGALSTAASPFGSSWSVTATAPTPGRKRRVRGGTGVGR